MIVKGNIKMNKFPPIKAPIHNNDYTLLESIDIPEKVGVEEVRHIGKVLEQALPNAGDSPKLGHMRLSPNIIEKCTESINESKPDTTNTQPIFSPIGMEIDIDGDTFTRSTSTLTVGSTSNLPLLDMSGGTDLLHRQEAARDTMIKNNISLDRDAKIPGRRSNNCDVCFKNRGTFTFQGRKHIQMNKTTKGAKLKWHCPLADPQEQYIALLTTRIELKQKRNQRFNEKRRAKRRSP